MDKSTKSMGDAHDERIKRTDDPARDARSVNLDQAKGDDGLVTSAADRKRMYRNEWLYEALPDVPKIPGWHFCWLSTTNSYDPIPKRLRLGYLLVKADELSGEYDNLKMHSGQYSGHIMVNEMVLAKLPQDVYVEYMQEVHHNMPIEEERQIREGARAVADENRDSRGRELLSLEEGTESLGQYRKAPSNFA